MSTFKYNAINPFIAILAGAFLLGVLSFTSRALAEIISLHDGQVINGEIIQRGDGYITVKTKYQTRQINLGEVKSIEKERKGFERVYILTRENAVISGYLVEEDALRVVYREGQDAPDKTLSKLNIVKMSGEEISPVDLEFRFMPGAFIPLNTGGSHLGPATSYMGSAGFNALFVPRMRLLLDAGYAKSVNGEHSERYLQVIPVIASAVYPFRATSRLEIIPRLGLGFTRLEYYDGEKDELSTMAMTTVAGLSLSFSFVPRRFYLGLFADYMMLYDFSAALHAVVAGVFAGFRL
ncbi:MAG: hypothetical protein EPN93_18615 [Spirochaetes bacterium]|nr:MAG: hypothetical protein EPN93_18615 [Spirochaetota bacterium]